LREKIALGCGFVASQGSDNIIHVLANPVYNVTMGLSPALIGVLLFIQRVWSLVADPIAGQFSDNFRSRFGRRRPLLGMAAVPLALFFAGLWLLPSHAAGRSLFLYLLAVSLLFYTARSFYSIPLLALQAEATGDHHERTRLTGFTQIFYFVFAIVPNWLFAWIQGPVVAEPLAGVRCVGFAFGALFLAAGLVPVFLARERLYGPIASRQGRESLRRNLRTVVANRPFLLILGAQCATSFGYNVVGVLGLYITFYYVYGGDIPRAAVMQSWAGTAFQVAAIVSIPLYRRLSAAIGKKGTLQVAAAVLMAGGVARMTLFQPGHPWLIVLIWAASGAGTAGVSILCLSMLADAIDCEELRTGARREGVYASALSLCDKLGYSVGGLLSGFILVGIGFDVHLGGRQQAETLFLMRSLYAALPFAGALAAALIIHRYPLSQGRADAIADELKASRRLRAAFGKTSGLQN
jgi:GPH family glycoside/pentoside/hexuronide:cation symporter